MKALLNDAEDPEALRGFWQQAEFYTCKLAETYPPLLQH
jgi:hypothetical protein